MNRQSLRAFAFGMLFSVSAIGSYYFIFEDKREVNLTDEEAKELLKSSGFEVLTVKEFEEAKKAAIEGYAKEQELSKEVEEKKEKADNERIEENEEQEDFTDEEEEKVLTYELEIKSGMSTAEISSLLANAGIIGDAAEFEQYLISENYNTKVQVGTFELTNKMSKDEIARIITKS
ncbi:aminodeoxychorismate lyase [Cytobacillus sp. FJAT-54145]|uniref:Aminodeoxychorismate lyase n=1 Tax=Cytobacillus spartinae TaxID=3299023 RepID=A0ABW6KE63_9BACI